MANEAAEIVVFEISRQDTLREVQRVNDDEAVVGRSPSDEPIGRRIVDHLICLHNKRCDHVRVVVIIVVLHFFPFLSLFLSLYMFLLLVKKLRSSLEGLYKQNKYESEME